MANALLIRGVREQIVNRLRDEILSGRLAEGERLSELQLAKRFRVSRGPIREAIGILPMRALTPKGYETESPKSTMSFVLKSMALLIESVQTSEMLRASTVTASDSGFSRRPLHAGQGLSDMYRSSSCFRYSDCVSS